MDLVVNHTSDQHCRFARKDEADEQGGLTKNE